MNMDYDRVAKAIIELSEALGNKFGPSEVIAALEENMVIDTAEADLIEDAINDLKK